MAASQTKRNMTVAKTKENKGEGIKGSNMSFGQAHTFLHIREDASISS